MISKPRPSNFWPAVVADRNGVFYGWIVVGVTFVALPSNHENPPTRAQVEQFLEIMGSSATRYVKV